MLFQLITLIVGDVVCATLAISSSFLVRFDELPTALEFFASYGLQVAFFTLVALFTSYLMELYDIQKKLKKREIVVRSIVSSLAMFFLLSALYYLLPVIMFGRGLLFLSLSIFTVLQVFWHVIHKYGLEFSGGGRRVLVLGTGHLANLIGGVIKSTNHNHILAGYFGCSREMVSVPDSCIVGSEEEGVANAARRQNAQKIVISLTERRGVFPLTDLMDCKFSGIEVIDAPSFYEQVTGKLLLENITPGWFIFSNGFKVSPLSRIFKKMFDKVLAVFGLVVLSPLLIIVASAVKLTSPGPVLFRQIRTGMHEKDFVLYKFRTMRNDAESGTGAVWALKNDPRVTAIGGFLRKTRLDEIPQLFNVLKGDMSFIGPRPERPEFVEMLKKEIPYYSQRHFVKPGITGWAQIKYPYGASVADAIEKLRYDLYYLKNISCTLDLLIFFETMKVVIFGKGAR